MRENLLFPDKASMESAIESIPFENKVIAMEEQGGESWMSTFVEKPIVYNTVDLGLPSGLLWADKNIGATSPEEAGLYFQWGDVQGYTAEQVGTADGQKEFSLALTDYKFYDGTGTDYLQGSGFTKYNGSDGKTVLDLEDDAAHVLMGGNWRLPTHEDLHELATNTDMFLVPTEGEEIAATLRENDAYPTGRTYFDFATTASTCTGMKFYKKDDHSVYLFVPAGGAAGSGSVMLGDSTGGLWSSSVYSSNVSIVWSLIFYSANGYGNVGSSSRHYGFPLRGVSPQ